MKEFNSDNEEKRLKELLSKSTSEGLLVPENFFEKMGVPTTLTGYGVKAESIPTLIEKLSVHSTLPIGEHKDITAEVATKILEAAA